MKNVLIIAVLVVGLTSCTTQTKYGDCVGLADQKAQGLIYKYSSWNIIVGFFFGETVIVPALVVAKQLECPIGVK